MGEIFEELNGKDYIEGLYRDYEIRVCRADEYKDVSKFLDEYWKKNHIFVTSKEVFDFQHYNKSTNEYNFLIAKEKETQEIHAVLGFVPVQHFAKDSKRTIVWPCLWKSREDVNRKGLGIILYYHLKETVKPETLCILGISEVALSIYKHFNFTTGLIEHFVMPNFKAEEHLAKGLKAIYSGFEDEAEDTKTLTEISKQKYMETEYDESIFSATCMYKSKEYFLNRFLNHPVYKYIMLGIGNEEGTDSIIVARSCGDGLKKCLRIVEYIGDIDDLSMVRNQLQDYLCSQDYEYVDFMEVSLNRESIERAGFIDRRDYRDVIIPNYFEPYVQKNVDLAYAYKTVADDLRMALFKADGDQDRPNILPKGN